MTATELIATEDASAVRAVLNEIYAAWADNDPDAFVARYAADATAVHTGVYMPNRDAIRATIAAMFAGELKGSKGVHEVQSIRFVGTDTAIVLSKGAIVLAGQDEAASESRTIDGWVLCRHDGAWRVEAFHNCAQSPA
jgi:uncharacterized protein (TIGR02246 family)